MASYRERAKAERFEKRKIPRFPVQLPAVIGDDVQDFTSICTDLSSEGLSIETSTDYALGERLSIQVVISSAEEPLKVIGQIVWRGDIKAEDRHDAPIYEFGLRFIRPLPSPFKPEEEAFPIFEEMEEDIPEMILPYRR